MIRGVVYCSASTNNWVYHEEPLAFQPFLEFSLVRHRLLQGVQKQRVPAHRSIQNDLIGRLDQELHGVDATGRHLQDTSRRRRFELGDPAEKKTNKTKYACLV